MNQLVEYDIHCPYCGEAFSIFVDDSVAEQNYIEDCQICCHPITFHVRVDYDGLIEVNVFHENE